MNINRKSGLNRKCLALLCIPLAFLLPGCIKLDMALTVNKDKTVRGTVILGIADSLVALGSTSGSSGIPTTGGLDGLINKKAKGVTVSSYYEGGFTGEKVTFDHAPLSAFSSAAQEDGSFAIDVKGNEVFISDALDLSSTAPQSLESLAADEALTKAMFASAQVRRSITFPGKIIESTGVISQDRRSVTWNPTFGDKTDLATTVALDSPMNLIAWADGALLLNVLVLRLIYRNRKKKSPNLSSAEVANKRLENEGGETHSI